ncbi:MAG: DUF927 domain-containing protein [Bacillota bacterium]|nr:DUF927 domain-containing protein [Bacillota bacterium]
MDDATQGSAAKERVAELVGRLLNRAETGEPIDAQLVRRALAKLDGEPGAEELRARAEAVLAKAAVAVAADDATGTEAADGAAGGEAEGETAGSEAGSDEVLAGDEAAAAEETILDLIRALPESPSEDEIDAVIEAIAAIDSDLQAAPLKRALAKKLGAKLRDVADAIAHARARMAAAAGERRDDRTFATLLHGQTPPGMPAGLVLPPPYALSPRVRPGHEDEEPDWHVVVERPDFVEEVLPAVVVPIARRRDPDADSWSLALAVRRNGSWITVEADRSTLADSRKILQLADSDFPINSDNAKLVVRYIADVETANLHLLPSGVLVRSLGWREIDGRRCFVLGERILAAPDPSGAPGDVPPITVRPPEAGERRLMAGFATGGTRDGWIGLYRRILPYPRIRIGLYASLAAPLISHVGVQGFTIHYAGLTSKGKTTAQQIAASVWGYPGGPGLEARPGLIVGWNGTFVGNEQLAAFLRNLPALLDDSGLVQDREVIAQTLYAIANGMGRRRGARSGGTRATGEWALTAISTGERIVTSSSADAGGAQVRVIELEGNVLAPMRRGGAEAEGALSEDRAAELMRELRRLAGEHYGVVVEPYLRTLMLMEDIELQQKFDKALHAMLDAAGDAARTDMGSRLAGAFATMALAADIMHEAIGLDAEIPRRKLWAEIGEWFRDYLAENPPEHVDLRAYRELMGWIAAHAAEFAGGPGAPTGDAAPKTGWSGKWSVTARGPRGPVECVAVVEAKLYEVLADMGYSDGRGLVRQWRDRGLLVPDADGKHLARKVRLGTSADSPTARCFALVRDALDEDEDGAEIPALGKVTDDSSSESLESVDDDFDVF